MDKKEAKKRIERLKKVIKRHRYLYHVLDKQEISDGALDSLKHELSQLEQKYPEFITSDSPTQRVGGKPLDKFKKVNHSEPMLSIEDIFSKEELYDWEDYIKKLTSVNNFKYFCELKVDGFAVSLIYVDGLLDRGATRGDGKTGEDVTNNLKTIESIPLKLSLHKQLKGKVNNNLKSLIQKGEIEVRGEVYMDKRDFEKVNDKRLEEGK